MTVAAANVICTKFQRLGIVSHVLQLVEPGLHGVNIVCLGGITNWSRNLTRSGSDLTTSFHSLLVTHLSEQFHDFTVVDGGRVDIVKSCIHITRLDVHIFEYLFKATDATSDTERIHLFHAALEHWDRVLDLSGNFLSPMCTLEFGSQGTHFDSESPEVEGLFPIPDHVLSEDFGIFHLIFFQSLS
jgi:hypothetical protein